MGIDLLWADPDQWAKGWQANSRGVSYVFGQDVVLDTCEKLGLDLISRAHQVKPFKALCNSRYSGRSGWLRILCQPKASYHLLRYVLTIWIFNFHLAPHYCGQFDNSGGTMAVDENLCCSFAIYRPTAKAVRVAMNSQREKKE
jgi:hypothetical protein